MNARSIFLAFLPRHWLKWIAVNAVLLFLVFWSLAPNGDPRSDDPAVFERTGNHATWGTVLFGVMLFCSVVFGFVHCWRRSTREGALHGSAADVVLTLATGHGLSSGRTLSARDPREQTIPRPDGPSVFSLVVKGGLVPEKPVVSAEDHGTFTVVDRRRFADEVE